MSEQTKVLLISLIPFDNKFQKSYNPSAFSDTIYERITEKANYPEQQKARPEAFWGKRNVPAKVIHK